jgi:hypothetical protein
MVRSAIWGVVSRGPSFVRGVLNCQPSEMPFDTGHFRGSVSSSNQLVAAGLVRAPPGNAVKHLL